MGPAGRPPGRAFSRLLEELLRELRRSSGGAPGASRRLGSWSWQDLGWSWLDARNPGFLRSGAESWLGDGFSENLADSGISEQRSWTGLWSCRSSDSGVSTSFVSVLRVLEVSVAKSDIRILGVF